MPPIAPPTPIPARVAIIALWLSTAYPFYLHLRRTISFATLRWDSSRVVRLYRSPPLDDSNQHNYDRQHQQNVDESAQRVRGHKSQQPHNQQNYCNRPKQVHFCLLRVFLGPTSVSLGSRRLRISRFPVGALARVHGLVDEFASRVGCSLRLPRHFLPLCNRFVDPVLRFVAQQRSRLFP